MGQANGVGLTLIEGSFFLVVCSKVMTSLDKSCTFPRYITTFTVYRTVLSVYVIASDTEKFFSFDIALDITGYLRRTFALPFMCKHVVISTCCVFKVWE